jgi:hypothetical protein
MNKLVVRTITAVVLGATAVVGFSPSAFAARDTNPTPIKQWCC